MTHHLVVLKYVYLEAMLRGTKRIECRLGATRKPPFARVATGDLLWFKSPSGPILALGRVGWCKFAQPASPAALTLFLKPHLRLIQAEPEFFNNVNGRVRYASLIFLDCVVRVTPMILRKRDQRAWVVLPRAPRPGMSLSSGLSRNCPGKRA